jgi:hypothetical protein
MNVPDLKRISYFNGQRLTAADLTGASQFTQELRWLHNRGLHGWGIVSGLQVGGGLGSRSVTVSPGYALDALGREIVLPAEAIATVPAVTSITNESAYFLAASWIPDAQESVLESGQGPCAGSGAVRLSDAPLIAWRSQQELRNGLDVVLAQAWIRNSRLSRPLSITVRRNARPAQQPYIVSGQVDGSLLKWTQIPGGPPAIGLQAEVGTSEAQFGGTPQYFVQLDGERYLPGAPGPLLAVCFATASNMRPDGFTLQVLLPQGTGIINPPALLDPVHVADIMKALAWQVVWIGVEG